MSDWPGWVAWYVAEQRGLFRKYGADVKLIWFPSYSDSIAALEGGRIDANSQTWSDTLAQRARGAPVKAVLVNDNSAGNDAIVARRDIASLRELKGRSVALEQHSVSQFMLATALARHGMSLADIRLVNLSAPAAAAALRAGRVDAAVVWNPWVREVEQNGGGRTLFTSREMPGLIAGLLVAREQSIQSKRAELVAAIRAWYELERVLREDTESALSIMAKAAGVRAADYGLPLSDTRFFDAAANRAAFDAAQPESLVAVAPIIENYLRQMGFADHSLRAGDALDASLLRDAGGAVPRGSQP
ncbi:MAG: ABC transporter substrate-binding protein [Rhodocyclaceae bacterium]|nr:ABC transporter substrate-binding protein [Rhodocyclaceae bacterium]MBX3669733.1 ABC transporter substrate-binding protein [Rhodocyclaceae bacterium]